MAANPVMLYPRQDALASLGVDGSVLSVVADWIERFVAMPHKDLGRKGPVCPFAPNAIANRTLWFAVERGPVDVDDAVLAIGEYKARFRQAQPVGGDEAIYKSLVVVFPDLRSGDVKQFFDDVLARTSVESYVEEGLVLGGFYPNNDGTAIHNSGFHPFKSPVPFLLIRNAVVSDWKFFLDDAGWFNRWSRRFGSDATRALAEELREFPWRTSTRADVAEPAP